MDQLLFREFSLQELREPQTWQQFLHIQQPWIEAGVTRWLQLLSPLPSEKPLNHPVFVLGAALQTQPDRLLGTLVGTWQEAPIARFDDLLEKPLEHPHLATDRPLDGVWHFIAVTVAHEAEGQHLGRALVGAGLAWLDHNAPHARARTLSPAVGLPKLMELVENLPNPQREAILHLADDQGRPLLEILRLHLGAGATLEAILPDSRRDEVRSGRVTLRFAYEREPDKREQQKLAYHAWIERRKILIQQGNARKVADHWLLPDCHDAQIGLA